MKVTTPNTINLLSSNVSESLHSEWDSGVTYSTGDRVYVTLESDGTTERAPHRIFESTADSNTGNYPPDTSQWALVGSTNRWRMFDEFTSSQTENATSIDVTLGMAGDRLALLDVVANTVQIVTRDSNGTQLDDVTIDLNEPFVTDWFEYFFAPIERRQSLAIDLPADTAEIDLTVNDPNAAKVGTTVIGNTVNLGTTTFGAQVSLKDFSRKETSSFGETTLIERDSARILDVPVFLTDDTTAQVIDRIASTRGTAVLWDANESGAQFDALRTFGFFRDFDPEVSGLGDVTYNIEIRGLT